MSRTYARALVLAAGLSLSIGGCAGRPTPDTLTPTAQVAGLKLVTVFVATTRSPAPNAPTVFTEGRSSKLSYARYVISIPPGHKAAEIEWPTAKPDPARSFAVVSSSLLSEAQFAKETATTAARTRGQGERRDVGLFVHGYNYSFQESLFRLAQIDADANIGGAAVLFAWPSSAALTGYVTDKESVTFSRDGLAHVLELLAKNPGAPGVTLVGHSMGGWLTMEAVRQLRLQGQDATIRHLNDVILAAPDIDVDVFRQQLRVIGRLSSPITVLVAKDDKALSASRLLAGDHARAGSADVNDPIVQEAVQKAGVRVIDISQLTSANGSNHDRYASLAAIIPKLQSQLDRRSGSGAAGVGAFILDGAAATISSPFRIAGDALGRR